MQTTCVSKFWALISCLIISLTLTLLKSTTLQVSLVTLLSIDTLRKIWFLTLWIWLVLMKSGKSNVKWSEIKKFKREWCQEKERNTRSKKEEYWWEKRLSEGMSTKKITWDVFRKYSFLTKTSFWSIKSSTNLLWMFMIIWAQAKSTQCGPNLQTHRLHFTTITLTRRAQQLLRH